MCDFGFFNLFTRISLRNKIIRIRRKNNWEGILNLIQIDKMQISLSLSLCLFHSPCIHYTIVKSQKEREGDLITCKGIWSFLLWNSSETKIKEKGGDWASRPERQSQQWTAMIVNPLQAVNNWAFFNSTTNTHHQ